ncbi:MAG: hypothetical protein EOP06_15445 [Proteobacteria bacterium]|nr:MAG: hypothetical protein EOP06_15445 [Pseudomonadota bacterium]
MAKYHFGEWGSPEYEANFLQAKTEFAVIESTKEEKAIESKLAAARSLQDASERKAALWQFLKETPKSFFRIEALDELLNEEYATQSWQKVIEVCQLLRKEQISETKSELMRQEQAAALAQLARQDKGN